jgi:hypothetical protein
MAIRASIKILKCGLLAGTIAATAGFAFTSKTVPMAAGIYLAATGPKPF